MHPSNNDLYHQASGRTSVQTPSDDKQGDAVEHAEGPSSPRAGSSPYDEGVSAFAFQALPSR